MDQQKHRHSLYKEHKAALSPRQYNCVNRQLQEANRQKKRSDLYQRSRHISPSPTPQMTAKNKENHQHQKGRDQKNAARLKCNVSTVSNKSRTAKLICTARDPEKIRKQEAFILRYLDWKDKKKALIEKQKNEPNKKRPFVSACNKNSGFGDKNTVAVLKTAVPPVTREASFSNHNESQVSFVPKGHNEFQPPPGIKHPEDGMKEKIKSRVSIYTIVPTPPRKPKSNSQIEKQNQIPLARKVTTTISATKAATSMSKSLSNVKKTFSKQNSADKTEKPLSTVVKTNFKPRSLKMPPPPTVLPTKKAVSTKIKTSNVIAPSVRINSVNSIGTTKTKSTNLRSKNSPTQPHKNARLTQTMKAKKTTKATSGPSSTKLMSLVINEADNNQLVADMMIQTPREFSNSNHFDDFVTSTKVKNSTQTLEEASAISPIEPIVNRTSTTAKRNILNVVPKKKRGTVKQNEQITNTKNNEIVTTTSHSRFNFVRYSEINTSINDEDKEDEVKDSDKEEDPKHTIENLTQSSEENANPRSPQYSEEVRRTLEDVSYYRKQLQNEIDRLHKKCDEWEAYKIENREMLNEANVDDMIDVAIGQTRLLTSKKFMQFKGLIDRCESGATGIGHRPYDGSEATKFISSTDLEGFWSMLGLQVDNLEQRFENLNRWKNNNWQDPDEIKPKVVKPKNLTKVKKKTTAPAVKAKPSAALQQMLRKYQAEMREKKKNNVLVTTDDVIVTPCKVKDRKYFSPAATVIHIPISANSRKSLSACKNSQDSPNRRVSIGVGKARKNSIETPRKLSEKSPAASARRVTLHESVMRANVEAQSSAAGFSSPKVQSRKSILKTPGSARTNLRNVIFNQKCRVKKFNFVLNDEDEVTNADGENAEECNESIEEDMKQNTQDTDQEENGAECGTYSLRNRKVRLRPSSEIIIPK